MYLTGQYLGHGMGGGGLPTAGNTPAEQATGAANADILNAGGTASATQNPGFFASLFGAQPTTVSAGPLQDVTMNPAATDMGSSGFGGTGGSYDWLSAFINQPQATGLPPGWSPGYPLGTPAGTPDPFSPMAGSSNPFTNYGF